MRLLAEGVDPTTGEQFDEQSCYQKAEIVRALFTAAKALEDMVRRQRKAKALPAKTGSPWTVEEDSALASRYDEGKAISEIAKYHARTESGIRARLIKIGKITGNPDQGFKNFDRAR